MRYGGASKSTHKQNAKSKPIVFVVDIEENDMEKKKITRRDFIKSASVLTSASLLAACAPETVEVVKTVEVEVEKEVTVVETVEVVKEGETVIVTATPAPTEPPEPVTVEVWWHVDIPDLTTEWEQNNADNEAWTTQWNWGGLARFIFPPWIEANPGVSLNITGHSWDAELRTNQLLALAAGLAPDTTLGEAYVTEFVRLGAYNSFPDEIKDLFPEGPIAGSIVDGAAYALPGMTGTNALGVNLDVLEAAGLPTDALPTTWDELVAAAQQVSAVNRSEEWGNNAYFTYGPEPTTYGTAMRILPWFNQIGAPLSTPEGVPTANMDGSVDAWLYHNQLMWTSTKDLIYQPEGEAGAGKLFGEGVIAFVIGWSNNWTSVGQLGTNAVAIPLPLPPGGSPGNIVIGNTLFSPLKAGKQPELGIKLLSDIYTNEDNQAWMPNNAGIWIPALKTLLEQWETYDKLDAYMTDTAKDMVRVTMKELLGNAVPLPPWSKNGARIWAEWNETYRRIWEGNLGADAIRSELDALQQFIEDQLV